MKAKNSISVTFIIFMYSITLYIYSFYNHEICHNTFEKPSEIHGGYEQFNGMSVVDPPILFIYEFLREPNTHKVQFHYECECGQENLYQTKEDVNNFLQNKNTLIRGSIFQWKKTQMTLLRHKTPQHRPADGSITQFYGELRGPNLKIYPQNRKKKPQKFQHEVRQHIVGLDHLNLHHNLLPQFSPYGKGLLRTDNIKDSAQQRLLGRPPWPSRSSIDSSCSTHNW